MRPRSKNVWILRMTRRRSNPDASAAIDGGALLETLAAEASSPQVRPVGLAERELSRARITSGAQDSGRSGFSGIFRAIQRTLPMNVRMPRATMISMASSLPPGLGQRTAVHDLVHCRSQAPLARRHAM